MAFNNLYLKLKSNQGTLSHWFKLVTITGFSQIVVQATALISGILIIRILPVEEYAFYTLVNTMLSTMTVLADGGISVGAMAEGGKVWQDNQQLGTVLVTALDLRKKFAILSLSIAVPILFYLLIHHGASVTKSVVIILCLIPAFLAALSDSLLEISLKLRQDIMSLQKNQVWVNILRLLLTPVIFFSPFASLAIIMAGIPRILGNMRLKKVASAYVDFRQQASRDVRKRILKLVAKIMPSSIYICFSSQLIIWLMSIFGKTTSLAKLGALSRISLLLTVISTLYSTLVIPRYARLPTNKKTLIQKYIVIIFSLVFINLIVLLFVYLFPSIILKVLGGKYAGLDYELLLCALGNVLMIISNVCYALYSNRGWVINPVIGIPLHILIIIIGLVVLRVNDLRGILLFNIWVESVNLLINMGFGVFKILRIIPSDPHSS